MLNEIRPGIRRLLRLSTRGSMERDADDEIRLHLELRIRQLMDEGLSPQAARAEAQRRFGDVETERRRSRAAAGRHARRIGLRETLGRARGDTLYAIRTLRAAPGFTMAAVLALALGIGATTAMLSVVRAVLVEPLPYANAQRLVVLLHGGNNPVAPANFDDWRAQTRSFTEMAAAEYWTPDLTGGDDPQQITALRITSGMLPMLGVQPLLGREFAAGEDTPGLGQVVILSYGLWQRHFGGDPGVLGKPMSLNGKQYTIVGVMPRSFQFAPFWATHAELWAPLSLEARSTDRRGASLRVFARLKPGVTLAQARGDVAAVTARLNREYPGTNKDVQVVPLKEKVVGGIQTPLVVLMVAVAFVLLIACSNVAHMLLARGATRQRELAIRTALGATRSRIASQLLVESGLLAMAGGAVGLLLAVLSVRALVAASPAIIPRVAGVTVDWHVIVAALAVTFITALVFGLLPAVQATRVSLTDIFRDGDRAGSDGRSRGRMRSVLVASEFALALVLLVGAGLMIRAFIALERVDPGFDPHNVLTMLVSPARLPGGAPSRDPNFYTETLARVRGLPGVAAASYINHLPLAGDEWRLGFHVEGRPRPLPGDSPSATYRVVFPGYFATMRIPLRRGRDITDEDRLDAAPVAVINEYMARQYWPGEDAVGKRFTMDDSTWITIVGVSKNDVRGDWSAPPREEMFLPFLQRPATSMTLVVRAACGDDSCDAAAAALAVSVRAAIRGVDRGAPISAVQTMNSVVASATADQRFYVVLLVAFAGVAIVLAAVGIYGVMSYSVSRRAHEIGIRMALGAAPASVVRGVVAHGVAVAAAGAAAGLLLALSLTRMMRNILYGVSPADVLTYAAVTSLLLVVAVAATLIPARRATRVDPVTTLRAE